MVGASMTGARTFTHERPGLLYMAELVHWAAAPGCRWSRRSPPADRPPVEHLVDYSDVSACGTPLDDQLLPPPGDLDSVIINYKVAENPESCFPLRRLRRFYPVHTSKPVALPPRQDRRVPAAAARKGWLISPRPGPADCPRQYHDAPPGIHGVPVQNSRNHGEGEIGHPGAIREFKVDFGRDYQD